MDRRWLLAINSLNVVTAIQKFNESFGNKKRITYDDRFQIQVKKQGASGWDNGNPDHP
jgi:hypothetical protein